MARAWLLIGALLGASGVALGAYHAHGLEKAIARPDVSAEDVTKRMDNCATAVRYQMYHVPAVLAIGILSLLCRSNLLNAAGVVFLLGLGGFAGGLYLYVFTGQMIWWLVPLGGLLLIVGWVMMFLAGISIKIARDF